MAQLRSVIRPFSFKSLVPTLSKCAVTSQPNLLQANISSRDFHSSTFSLARSSPSEVEDIDPEDDEVPDDKEFKFDDHTVPALQYLRQVRYVRMFMRKAKYEAPTLKEKATPFVPPSDKTFAKFLQVEHLGEPHKLDIRSTLIIDLKRLIQSKLFTEPQIHKLLLICNNHHFQDSGVLRFSSNNYPTYEENKLSLAKLWKKIEAEVRDPKDMFDDIPLPAPKPKKNSKQTLKDLTFPSSWLRPQQNP